MAEMTANEVVDKINGLIQEKMASTPTIDDVNHIKSEIETLKSFGEKSHEIEKSIAKLEGKFESLSERAIEKGVEPRTIGEKAIKGIKDQIDSIKDGKSVSFDIKADTTITGDYTGNIALSVLDPQVNRIARERILLQNVVNRGTTTSKFVTYIQQTLQSTADYVAEAGAKPQGELKYQEVSKEVKKIAGVIKVSKEMLADLPFMQNEINTDLMASVADDLENGILNGTGVGSQLEGMYTLATAWTAGTFANTIISANLHDVIRVACANIEAAKFFPTHVVLNPLDVAKLQLTKTSTGEYTYPIFYLDNLSGQPKIANLTVVSTTWIAADKFLVADMSKDNLRMREAMNITFGYENDDFTRNMISIICETRAVNYIKANDLGAFQKGTISTSIAALDPAIAP
jgi:HK97 family phage major capsid protein